MIASGIPEPDVQRTMGRKSAIMTRRYAHIQAEQMRTAMSRFEEALRQANPERERGEC